MGKDENIRISAFLRKLYKILSDPVNHRAIYFRDDMPGIQIKNEQFLEENVFPNYFRHSNCPSFYRQLNIYGFLRMKATPLVVFYHPQVKSLIDILNAPNKSVAKKKYSLRNRLLRLGQSEDEPANNENLPEQSAGLNEAGKLCPDVNQPHNKDNENSPLLSSLNRLNKGTESLGSCFYSNFNVPRLKVGNFYLANGKGEYAGSQSLQSQGYKKALVPLPPEMSYWVTPSSYYPMVFPLNFISSYRVY